MSPKPLMETARFHDLLCEGKLTRRDAKRVMASFGVASLTMHTMPGSAFAQEADEEHPIFFTWGGYDEPEFMVHYTAKYGREPNYTFFDDEDNAFAKMRSGFNPHVTYPCGPSLTRWYDAGFLAPIETRTAFELARRHAGFQGCAGFDGGRRAGLCARRLGPDLDGHPHRPRAGVRRP